MGACAWRLSSLSLALDWEDPVLAREEDWWGAPSRAAYSEAEALEFVKQHGAHLHFDAALLSVSQLTGILRVEKFKARLVFWRDGGV